VLLLAAGLLPAASERSAINRSSEQRTANSKQQTNNNFLWLHFKGLKS
jgi:hypothetical protein